MTGSPGMQQRFQETMDFFFQAVTRQAHDREIGVVPDLDSYIWLRRDTSGCKPCWALIEYAYNLRIPDEVMEHPIIVSLGEATNDLVTWSNVRPLSLSSYALTKHAYAWLQDIFSYNVEQSKGTSRSMQKHPQP